MSGVGQRTQSLRARMRKFWISAPDALRGSLRSDPMVYVAAWFRLLCLCAESPVWGVVCLNDKEPYTTDLLAVELGFMHEFKDYTKAVDETQKFLDYQKEKERIELLDWGGIRIINWDKYQSGAYARKRRQRAKEKDEGVETQNTVTPARDNVSRPPVTNCHAIEKETGVSKETPWKEETHTLEKENTTPPTTLARSNASRSDPAASKANKSWQSLFEEQLTEEKLATIQEAFPSLDVSLEVSKMRAWLETHPAVAKRRKRFDLMLWKWLHKAQKRQERLKTYRNAKQRFQQHLQELKARGLVEDVPRYEKIIKEMTGVFVNALATLNPAINGMSGEAYDNWFAQQTLEIALLDDQLGGDLSATDISVVAEFLKQEECKFAIGDARDLRQKWMRVLPQARKWWRKRYGSEL